MQQLISKLKNIETSSSEVGQIEFYKEPQILILWLENIEISGGYYELEVMDFIKKTEFYPSEGIFVWIPLLQKFGSWDFDHWVLYIFKTDKESEIVENFNYYLSSQWNKIDSTKIAIFDQFNLLEFKEGSPF